MSIIKSYTDLNQSRKLAEILPHDTADGTWKRFAIAGCYLDVPEEQQYFHDGDTPFIYYSGIGIPSWSLAALLKILKDYQLFSVGLIVYIDNDSYRIDSDNPVDACYEMIIKLNELKLL